MNPIIVGVVGIVILFAILAFRVPIAFAMAAVGFVGFVILNSWKSAFSVVTTEPFAMVTSYTFSVLPVFVLMGQFAFHSGLGEKLFYTANKWLGQLPGGLAIATVGACAGFSAICGSTLATAATMGAVALPEMKKIQLRPCFIYKLRSLRGYPGHTDSAQCYLYHLRRTDRTVHHPAFHRRHYSRYSPGLVIYADHLHPG